MESKHIMISVISAALFWGSTVAWKEWLTSQEKKAEIQSRVQMSRLEKEKLAILNIES